MKKNKHTTAIFIFLSIILSSNLFINQQYNDEEDLGNPSIDTKDNDNLDYFEDTIQSPTTSIFGDSEWWDSSYQYRMLINVTNDYNLAFEGE